MGLNQQTYEQGVNMMSQIIASPKLVTPPPPNIQAKQPIRFTASVALFTERPHNRDISGSDAKSDNDLFSIC